MKKQYIEFDIRHQNINRTDKFNVVGGSQNYLYARFTFCEDWAGEDAYAIFTGGGKSYRQPIVDGECEVPWEVLLTRRFFVGCEAGDRITSAASVVDVKPSGAPDANPGREPSPTIQSQIGNLANLNTEAKENLVAAINEALTKGGGEVDDEAIDAVVKKYLTANEIVISVNSKTGVVELAAEDVGADPAGSAADAVSQHNVATDSHADLRLELQNLADRVNAVLDSDDITLDELSEIVAYIKSNKTLIDAITTSKVSVTDIIDNLVTNVANKPLSAAQGVVLKGMIEEIRGLIPPAYTLPVGGNELGGVKNGGNVTINEDGTMTAPEVSGGNGIAVTGASVGQTVKIAAVDEEGVPTAWEPVDMPSGEEWENLAEMTLDEDGIPFVDLGDVCANFRKLRFTIVLPSMTPTSITWTTTPAATVNMCYDIYSGSVGNADNPYSLFIEFEPLVTDKISKRGVVGGIVPGAYTLLSNISYIYTTYDTGRLLDNRYFGARTAVPSGTSITIQGVKA